MDGVVFVGDSDVDYWMTNTEIVLGSLNVGIAGATCDDVLQDIDYLLEETKPSWIILVCGENDLAQNTTVADTFDLFSDIVDRISDAGSHVLYLGTKPEPATKSLHGLYQKYDELVNGLAINLAEDVADPPLTFIDVYSAFVDLGNPFHLYQASDQLHLSFYGYELWSNWTVAALDDTDKTPCVVWKMGECVVRSTFSGTVSPIAATATAEPSPSPSENPAASPSSFPSLNRTQSPSVNPTPTPSHSFSISPISSPTLEYTSIPSEVSPNPSVSFSNNPSISPSETTENRSSLPSGYPSENPTASPSGFPSMNHTQSPSVNPTSTPSRSFSTYPTSSPTLKYTSVPSEVSPNPSVSFSNNPSISPSKTSENLSSSPSLYPTINKITASPSVALPNPSLNPVATQSQGPTPFNGTLPPVNETLSISGTASTIKNVILTTFVIFTVTVYHLLQR